MAALRIGLLAASGPPATLRSPGNWASPPPTRSKAATFLRGRLWILTYAARRWKYPAARPSACYANSLRPPLVHIQNVLISLSNLTGIMEKDQNILTLLISDCQNPTTICNSPDLRKNIISVVFIPALLEQNIAMSIGMIFSRSRDCNSVQVCHLTYDCSYSRQPHITSFASGKISGSVCSVIV